MTISRDILKGMNREGHRDIAFLIRSAEIKMAVDGLHFGARHRKSRTMMVFRQQTHGIYFLD
jgi:hypothetical protein